MATVLVIDDSPAARSELRRVLERDGRFERVLEAGDGLAGLRLLLAEPVDAVLCDLEMPGLDGEKLLGARRCRADGPEALFFFVTAERDPERMARLLRAGACDTLSKPFHPAELLARLDAHLRLRRLQAELREKNAMLARLSTTDPVTGLRTRRYVDEVLALEAMRATRYRTPLSVLMADLDHFKRLNDAHGHHAGDAVLAAVGDAIRGTLRATDTAARYGGEEFLVVLPQTALDGACTLAERLRGAIAEAEADAGADLRLRASASIGAAAFGDDVTTAAALVQAADAALYRAKRAGRDRVVAARGAPRG